MGAKEPGESPARFEVWATVAMPCLHWCLFKDLSAPGCMKYKEKNDLCAVCVPANWLGTYLLKFVHRAMSASESTRARTRTSMVTIVVSPPGGLESF